MKLKICGMKYKENIIEVANLQPDYMGFIFYEKSPRYVSDSLPELPKAIIKTGVFVNSSLEYITRVITQYNLKALQLHGNESVTFCEQLKKNLPNIEVIKVFSIKDQFDFKTLSPYEDFVDFFLFDTKGTLPGGNGYTFDWSVLKEYTSSTPFFLSGGIGLESVPQLTDFFKLPIAQKCYAIDVNSKFEIAPALKNRDKLKQFKTELGAVQL
ncbi:N-(5'-phosphoribosyl)anthranilate isomerase [Neptunitalea chrysea]|uniref:N-(5'-phosphoribosyl)anthranilate isomerase n=1 Tax=Neptunitalea chrysea TaxID=1647581 RepID=A0A9W6B413_9FLAO|nr:phosphoribosylanthranilate isomerase [Neptunitalea chrysea]GLB52121.1 N-(5'-phosphoribosyl)anthranilate isomerase [Neptunitalea chrysea]